MSSKPEEEEKRADVILETNMNDVLCGRGGRTNHHAGNIQFRRMVADRKKEYLDKHTKKLDKAGIAADIMNAVRRLDPPGRFLKENKDGTFFDVGDAKAIIKVGQALREGAPDLRPKMNKKDVSHRNKANGPSSAEKEREAGALLIALADGAGIIRNSNINNKQQLPLQSHQSVLGMNQNIKSGAGAIAALPPNRNNSMRGRKNGLLSGNPHSNLPPPFAHTQQQRPPYPYPPALPPPMMVRPCPPQVQGQGLKQNNEGGLLNGQVFQLLKQLEEKDVIIHILREQIISKDEQIWRLKNSINHNGDINVEKVPPNVTGNAEKANSGNGKKRKTDAKNDDDTNADEQQPGSSGGPPSSVSEIPPKRKRGRPKGSTNKPKDGNSAKKEPNVDSSKVPEPETIVNKSSNENTLDTVSADNYSINTKWNENYEALKEFKEREGHIKVPKEYNASLHNWTEMQRTLYKMRRYKPRLSPERVAKLKLLGFNDTATNGEQGDAALKDSAAN